MLLITNSTLTFHKVNKSILLNKAVNKYQHHKDSFFIRQINFDKL